MALLYQHSWRNAIKNIKLIQNILKLSLLLALIVVILGAWTRLSDAGLGCPDWPTCYGSIIVPDKISDDYTRPLETGKAWKEMLHRYAASLLGLMTIIIVILSFKKYKTLRFLSSILLITTLFQGALGAFTVTKLVHPGIVSMHLLGGFITTGLIYILYLKIITTEIRIRIKKRHKILLYLMILLLFIQIFLGGWVSTNYAAISCGDFFPSCLGQYYHPIQLSQVFYWGEFGINYEYGTLPESVRIAIQLLHRYGALIIVIFAIFFSYNLRKHIYLRSYINIFIALIIIQISLGITNIIASLPIYIAVMHNAVALLLLLSLLRIKNVIK